MPVSLAPISAELLADFQAGKETALEQLFRANFEALSKEANERIEDLAVAQKVVAGAFLEVWERRVKIPTSAALESLLHEAVAGGTTHELRRRAAAHHMASKTEGDQAHHAAHHAEPETTDQWWVKVGGVLHSKHEDPAELARKRAELSRHEAAAHMAKVARPRRTGLYVVVGLIIAVAAGVPLWYFNKGAETTKANQLLSRDDAKVIRSKEGQTGAVTLEDSVGVRIGPSTTVKYPAHYPMDARALQINGVAAIMAPADGKDVLIKVGNAWVYAQGAEFAARSFPEDSGAAMLKALSGSISVRFAQEQQTLNEGSTLYMLSNGTFMDLPKEKATFAFSWLDGKFISEYQPLRKVLSEVKRWYGIEIVPKDTSFLDRPVSMTATLDSSKVALAALEKGASVKVTLEAAGKASLVDAVQAPKPTRRRR